MEFKKALIWSHLQGNHHPCLNDEEKSIGGSMPLVAAVFPGINYYSMTGFDEVREKCLLPVLKKLFPDLVSMSEQDINKEDVVEIGEFLPSKGYEWQDSDKWKRRFQGKLAA